MAAHSIRKLILRALKTQMETIKKSAGYWNDIQMVKRSPRVPFQAVVYPSILIFERDEEIGANLDRGAASGVPSPSGKLGVNLPIELHGVLQTTEDDASDDCDNLLTDMERCVMTNEGIYYLSNGARFDLYVKGKAVIIAEAVLPMAAVQLDLLCTYAYRYGDPTEP
jgi:hypothetical protein